MLIENELDKYIIAMTTNWIGCMLSSIVILLFVLAGFILKNSVAWLMTSEAYWAQSSSKVFIISISIYYLFSTNMDKTII